MTATLAREFQADVASLDAVHDLIDDLWDAAPSVPRDDQIHFDMAVVEIAANVIVHSHSPSFSVLLSLDGAELCAVIEDTGDPVPSDLLDASGEVDFESESGRGIAMARAAADIVEIQRAGDVNRWTIRRAVH